MLAGKTDPSRVVQRRLIPLRRAAALGGGWRAEQQAARVERAAGRQREREVRRRAREQTQLERAQAAAAALKRVAGRRGQVAPPPV